MNPAWALQEAMRAALLAHGPLTALLGGAHIHEETPRGANASFVSFGDSETRDWSVMDAKAHEHLITISVATNSRSRKLAQQIASEVEAALDNVGLSLTGHALVNLRLASWSVRKEKNGENYGAALKFRAATEEETP